MPGVSDERAEPSAPAGDRGVTAIEEPPRRASRADLFGALAIVFGAAAFAYGPGIVARLGPHPSIEECDALLQKYVELKQRAIVDKPEPKAVAAALADARRLAGPKLSACTTEVTPEEADCARRAGYADELERCLR